MNTTPFMDKQIMDLSLHQTKDFIHLITHPNPEDHCAATQIDQAEILPNYDFHPIRPIAASSYSHSPISDPVSTPSMASNSTEPSYSNSTSTPTPVRNYTSLDSVEPLQENSKEDKPFIDANFFTEIDRMMKNHVSNLLHALDHVGARITQLESRTSNLECSLDELKVSVGNNHGQTEGIMRQFGNLLREVQSGVQVLNDNKEIAEAQIHLSNLQVSKIDHYHQPKHHNFLHSESEKQIPSAVPTPNAPPHTPSQLNPPSSQLSNQVLQNQILPVLPRDPYFPLLDPTQELTNLPHQLPSTEHGRPPTQYQPHRQSHSTQYLPSQDFQSSLNEPPSRPASGPSSSQQSYGTANPIYMPPSGKTSSEFFGPNNTSSLSNDLYNYYGRLSSPYSNAAIVKPLNLPSAATEPRISENGYSHHPPGHRTLPHALPTASEVSGGSNSGSAGTGNRVPFDDVVDKVTNMGFPGEQVRVAVRKLTENGQSVDLNVVLDKLMNDGEVQQRGWFGR